ncbi:MAG: polyprenyl synthetase family protein [Phocaeicola sp.]
MNKLDLIKEPIAVEFETFKEMFEASLDSSNSLLNEMLSFVMQKRGKQMRPALTLLMAKMVGNVNDAVYRSAISLELLHTASLIHDDVVDDSNQRRGQASVKGIYNNSLAVLLGDFILATSLRQAALTGQTKLVDLIARLGQQLADGEIAQLSTIQQEEFSIDAYFDVIKKKTAALFIAASEAGFVAAGGDDEGAKIAALMGEKMGMAFQMKDDLLDYLPSEEIGKPSGNDIREGKLTLPALYVLNNFPDAEMHSIGLKIKTQLATEAEINAFIDYVKKNGGIEFTEKQINAECESAISLLPHTLDKNLRIALISYINFITERTK